LPILAIGPQERAASACAPYRPWIEEQVQLGRNAQAIYQDLVDRGFAHKYNSVKRFVHTLKSRDPERFDVLEFKPSEESQVDYGQGAMTRHPSGKYRRPYLFIMTLAYSSKAFRKVVWKTDQQIWAQLHEEAFRSFGGSVRYVVCDNLKEGVLKPDLYTPQLNPVYSAMLAHYSAVADPCRVRDPDRKGVVERAIRHTQDTALKGRRFESIEEQNAHLARWEERWAATRIHGRKKRQVMEMFLEEKPYLTPLPLEPFRPFKHGVRVVDSAGLVQVEGSYYSALPAALYSEVAVRIYARDIAILDKDGQVLRRHQKSATNGQFMLRTEDRIFNPTRESVHLLDRIQRIGPKAGQLAKHLFEQLGRPGHRAIYALANLAGKYPREAIEAACECAMLSGRPSYQAVKRRLEQPIVKPALRLKQTGPEIRPIEEYQKFWDHATTHKHPGEKTDDDVDP
jgi:transposase